MSFENRGYQKSMYVTRELADREASISFWTGVALGAFITIIFCIGSLYWIGTHLPD